MCQVSDARPSNYFKVRTNKTTMFVPAPDWAEAGPKVTPAFRIFMNYDEPSDRGPAPAQMLQNTAEVYGCIRSCNIVTTNTGES